MKLNIDDGEIMSDERLIVDIDYAWVDTVTDSVIEVTDAFDLVNELHKENVRLKKPHCRKCSHFARDNADNYCMKDNFNSIGDLDFALVCEDYENVFDE